MNSLRILKKDNRTEIYLDDMRIRRVVEYKIESSTGRTAELTIKLHVKNFEVEI